MFTELFDSELELFLKEWQGFKSPDLQKWQTFLKRHSDVIAAKVGCTELWLKGTEQNVIKYEKLQGG